MNILLIHGSPRINGNTQIILDLFQEVLKAATPSGIQNDSLQHLHITQELQTGLGTSTVTKLSFNQISLSESDIQACHGCRAYMSYSENHCPCKDDVQHIEKLMKDADLILIGSPVYVEDISGLTKNWIDRMAYHCHRPFLDGIPVYLFTTSGAKASNHAIKTLKHALLAWGAKIVQSDNYSMGAHMNPTDARIKYETLIKKRAHQLLKRIKRNKFSIFSLIAFYVQKRKGKEKDSYDYRYWKSQGWLDKNTLYYHPVKINPLQHMIVQTIGTFVGIILY